MRHQLAALENELVLIHGWFKEHRKRKDIAHLLLSNVQVIKYEGESIAYNDAKPVCTLDHLWCREPGAENLKGRELFTKVFYVGRVKPYTRSNGSIDYGVVVEEFEDVDNYILNQLDPKLTKIRTKARNPLTRARLEMQCLSSILEILEDNSRHHVGRHYSTKYWREFLAKLYAEAANRFTIQLHRCEKQNRKDRRQKPKRVSSHSDQPARGFG